METKTEFKDYHLYLGAWCMEKGLSYPALFNIERLNQSILHRENYTLILRPLSDMTDEEAIEYGFDGFWSDGVSEEYVRNRPNTVREKYVAMRNISPKHFVKLLSQHFDLFGLISSGAAIDATKLKDNPYGLGNRAG